MASVETLTQLLEPVVNGLGYELVGLEYHPNRKRGLLRIYIDHSAGIGVDDCARVSHQVSGVLDVEEPVSDEYNLEVSSPGLDRPIFKTADYDRFIGEQIRVRLDGTLDGRRKFRGRLLGLEGDAVVIEDADGPVRVPLDRVYKAFVELEP